MHLKNYKTLAHFCCAQDYIIDWMVRYVEKVRGRVKWFNNEKGYGFIEYKDNEDIFVHYSAINHDGYKSLTEGQFVEFNLIETAKGYQALDVVVVKEVATSK